MSPKMNRQTLVIKKYGNRRLYNTRNSAYINQDEVAQLVREGHDIQVVDAATGEDLTRLVLTQIIVQNAKEPDSAFPVDVLRQMVVAGGRATQETTLKYLKTVLDMYQNAYRSIAPPINPFEFVPPVHPSPPSRWNPQPVEDSYPARADRRDEANGVDELKRRVEELSSMVSELAAGKMVGKRKRTSARHQAKKH